MSSEHPAAGATVRRRVLYSGNVQGVGFRYRTATLARRHEVVGTVENLPNGQVELTVEGETDVLDRFLAAVADELAEEIASTRLERSAATGAFDQFRIVK